MEDAFTPPSGSPRPPGPADEPAGARAARVDPRPRLVDTARETFAQLGYAGASMGVIATRAGIRKSSLFHHFSTKDELYRECLASVVADIGALVAEGLQPGGTTLERIDSSTAALQRYLGQNPVAARLLLREFVDGTAAVDAAGDAVNGVLRFIVDLLDTGMAAGEFPRADSRQLALSLIGLHFTCFATTAVSSRLLEQDVLDPLQVERRAQAVVDQVRALLRAPPRPRR